MIKEYRTILDEMKKRILIAICTLFCLVSCQVEEVPENNPARADMTVCAYLVADNNLDGFLLDNIETMVRGLAQMTEDSHLLVYWDGYSSIQLQSCPVLLSFRTDGHGTVNGSPVTDMTGQNEILQLGRIIKTYPEQNSVSLTVMGQVIEDMAIMVDTPRMGFIAGSHGSAWTGSIYGHPTRSFGQDGTGSDNTITIEDMASALSHAGRKFDFIVLDACMMGTAEVCYDLKDVADWLLVSAVDIPAAGFPYKDIMSDLYKGTEQDYISAAEKYIACYELLKIEGNRVWGTMSVVDCREMDTLADRVRKQLSAHKEDIISMDIKSLQQYGLNPYAQGFIHISVDMAAVMRKINGGAVPEDFASQLDRTVRYAGYVENTDDFHIDGDNYCGLGMYIPVPDRPLWNSFFKRTAWYKAVGWDGIVFPWD